MEENVKVNVKQVDGKFPTVDVTNELKEWCKKTFYFNRNLVYYLNPETEMTPELPKYFGKLDIDRSYLRTKKNFETPLSHLLAVTYHIGRAAQIRESEIAIEQYCKEVAEE